MSRHKIQKHVDQMLESLCKSGELVRESGNYYRKASVLERLAAIPAEPRTPT
jgi:hypothetical protein